MIDGRKRLLLVNLSSLNDLDLDIVIRLILHCNSPEEGGAIVELVIHMAQKIGCRDRCLDLMNLNLDVSQFGLNKNQRGKPTCQLEVCHQYP